MSESNQRSKTLIRELYELSESGALDQMDSKSLTVLATSFRTSSIL